jgi:hypothetical protein
MAAGYDSKVWAAIRELWEISPRSTSWKTILEHVAQEMNTEVPHVSAVTRKQAREGWRKTINKTVKKGVKTTVKKLEKIDSELRGENQEETDTSDANFDSENSENLTVEDVNKNDAALVVLESMPERQKGMRERLSDPKKLVRFMRSQAVTIFSIECMVTEGTYSYLCEVNKAGSPADVELASAKMAAFAGTAEVFEKISRGHERMIKSMCGLHGLDPDDFKDKQARSEATLIKIEVLKGKSAERMQRMREQQRIFLARDVAAMDAGEPPTIDGLIVEDNIPYDGFDEIDGGYDDAGTVQST